MGYLGESLSHRVLLDRIHDIKHSRVEACVVHHGHLGADGVAILCVRDLEEAMPACWVAWHALANVQWLIIKLWMIANHLCELSTKRRVNTIRDNRTREALWNLLANCLHNYMALQKSKRKCNDECSAHSCCCDMSKKWL